MNDLSCKQKECQEIEGHVRSGIPSTPLLFSVTRGKTVNVSGEKLSWEYGSSVNGSSIAIGDCRCPCLQTGKLVRENN